LPERTFKFALAIMELCRKLERRPGLARTLGKQILRSGTSIGANVEEGQSAQSEADFLTKYSIACKEARETRYWLRLLQESGLVTGNRLPELTQESGELVAILTAIIRSLKKKRA
jgi:four helix bundle protein